MAFRPPWKSPPPDLYKLKPVLGYRNHDITKKRAPAWSFVRYIPIPKPKPEVSMSPFQRNLRKKHGKSKKAQDWKQKRSDYVTEGGISKKKMQNRRKKHKRTRSPLRDDTLASIKKPTQDGSKDSKDKSKKNASRMSAESGRFVVAPDDMCDLCFPWMKKSKKSTDRQDDPRSNKKLRRSRSISLGDDITTSVTQQHHSFIVISRPQGRIGAADQVCEPHSGLMLPSGRKIAFNSIKRLLPWPPMDDENESVESPKLVTKKKRMPKTGG